MILDKINPHTKGNQYPDILMAKLLETDKILWAKIYCELNCWDFPNALIEIKPKDWDTFDLNEKLEISRPIMKKITDTLGERWVSREWNKDRMTEEEHNRWWIDHHL